MQDNYSQDFDLIRDAAQEAGKLALSYWGRSIQKQRKADGSEVTEADHAVDELLAARLKGARPSYGWLSEESGEHNDRLHARRVWVVDPIDGTRAFIQDRNDWVIALALIEDHVPVLAAVVNPVRGEVFEARVGAGAFLNGRRLHASKQRALAGARLVVPESLLKSNRWRRPWPPVRLVWANSIIYRMALVASGEADASFATKSKWEWDVAAGALLVSEAGGIVTDPCGFPLTFNSREAKVPGFLAAAPKLHHILAERMSDALDGAPVAQDQPAFDRNRLKADS
jgi:myo-inositol-1(or 4)-monophosphatase